MSNLVVKLAESNKKGDMTNWIEYQDGTIDHNIPEFLVMEIWKQWCVSEKAERDNTEDFYVYVFGDRILNNKNK